MPKIAASIAILLTLITGVIVGQLHLVAGSRVVTAPARLQVAADPLIAVAFYESLNNLIRTGDVSDLHAVVATGFVDNSPFLPSPGTAETLERYFQNLHAVAPEAVLQVEDVTADGALIAVRLQLDGVADLTVAGLPVLSPTGEGFELLRISEGRVVERWASPSLPALAETLGALDIRFDPDLLREPRMESIVLAPDAELSVNDHHGTILRVESGKLRVAVSAPNATASPVPPGQDPVTPLGTNEILQTSDSLSIPSMRSFRVRNTGRDEASLVWLSIRRVDSQTHPTAVDGGAPVNPGVEVELLAGGAPLRPGQGPFTLIADRMVAPPGTSIPLHTTGEFEMLLVESGAVDIALENKFVMSVTELGALRTQKDSFHLESGQGISAPFAVDLEYLAAGDEMTVLWVVTVGSPGI